MILIMLREVYDHLANTPKKYLHWKVSENCRIMSENETGLNFERR